MRLSTPHASVVGAHEPAANRLYELMFGAKNSASSRAHAICPARYWRNVSRLACERALAVAPKRRVDVARRADPRVVGLRHERHRAPVQVRDLLRAVLVDDVVVGHRQRVGVAEVDLLLAGPRLALRGLDADARAVHPVADLAQQRLVVGRREDVVVEDVRHRRRQVAVALRVRLLVRLAQQVELELRADHHVEPERARPLDLRAQHLARRRTHRRAVVPLDVAEDERRRLEPRDPPQRRQIRRQVEVAVPALPRRELVARHRVHLHVEREQVVAALGAVPVLDLLEEEVSVQALAEQPPLHVGERHDHRVDRLIRAQLLERQH